MKVLGVRIRRNGISRYESLKWRASIDERGRAAVSSPRRGVGGGCKHPSDVRGGLRTAAPYPTFYGGGTSKKWTQVGPMNLGLFLKIRTQRGVWEDAEVGGHESLCPPKLCA